MIVIIISVEASPVTQHIIRLRYRKSLVLVHCWQDSNLDMTNVDTCDIFVHESSSVAIIKLSSHTLGFTVSSAAGSSSQIRWLLMNRGDCIPSTSSTELPNSFIQSPLSLSISAVNLQCEKSLIELTTCHPNTFLKACF